MYLIYVNIFLQFIAHTIGVFLYFLPSSFFVSLGFSLFRTPNEVFHTVLMMLCVAEIVVKSNSHLNQVQSHVLNGFSTTFMEILTGGEKSRDIGPLKKTRPTLRQQRVTAIWDVYGFTPSTSLKQLFMHFDQQMRH
jgi:hypothetical protein